MKASRALTLLLLCLTGILTAEEPANVEEPAKAEEPAAKDAAATVDEEAINKLLDERIRMNIKYRDENAEYAKESSIADVQVPFEKKYGQTWVDYLKHVKQCEDLKIKEYALKLEYMDELQMAYDNLEYAEGLVEKAEAVAQVSLWKSKLAAVARAFGRKVGKTEK